MRRPVTLLAHRRGHLLGAGPITLSPGSILVGQPDLTDFTAGTISSFTKSGTPLGAGRITGLGDLVEGITVLNGNLFVGDGASKVRQINLATGASASSFSVAPFGLEALGSLNGNLLAMTFTSTAVSVCSTSGVLQTSINLNSLPAGFWWDGLASDGSILYLSDYNSGRIYQYSLAGTALGAFAAAPARELSGLSYDVSNNSLLGQ